jgi:hypothetical protein
MGTKYTGYSKSRKFLLLYNPRVNSTVLSACTRRSPKCCLSFQFASQKCVRVFPRFIMHATYISHIPSSWICYNNIQRRAEITFYNLCSFSAYFAVPPSSALCSQTSSVLLLGLPKERKFFWLSYKSDIYMSTMGKLFILIILTLSLGDRSNGMQCKRAWTCSVVWDVN